MKRFLSTPARSGHGAFARGLRQQDYPDTPDTPDTPDDQEEAIHIGIVTGSVSQSEDDRCGAEAFQQLYGEENVTLVTYPDNFTEELEPPFNACHRRLHPQSASS